LIRLRAPDRDAGKILTNKKSNEGKMITKVTTEPRENRQLGLSIEVDPARVQKELQKAARKVSNNYRFPGFRKGKVPFQVIAQNVGLEALYSEFVQDLGQELYKQAIEQEGIEPYAIASLEDVEFEPMTYKLLVPLEPEVELGDYRSLRVEEEPPVVDEADVEAQLNSYLEQHAGWQEVTRPSQYGDLMNIDVRSVIISDQGGEEGDPNNLDNLDNLDNIVLDETDWEVTPDQENPMEPPGFDEALLGIAPGEEKEFVLNWPAESQSIHAGKSARFHVKVNSIQAYEKPELTDEFAQLVGPDFATLDDLKASIRDTLREQAQVGANAQYAEKVLNALVEQSTLNYPPVVVEDQMDSMTQEFERQLRQFGIENLEDYLQRTNSGTLEEYRERLRPEAGRLAEQNLVLSEVLRREKLAASDEEIETRIRSMFGEETDLEDESVRSMVETLRTGAGRSILESQVLRQKALDLLLDIARGNEVPPPPADDAPADEAEATPAEAAPEAAY
jgi:trigger factor